MSDTTAKDVDVVDLLLKYADGVEQTSADQWRCLCPAHDDHDPSLSFSRAEDGKPLVHCFACCAFEDVYCAIMDLARDDLDEDLTALKTASKARRRELGKFVERYEYHDEEGRVLYAIARYVKSNGGKNFALQVQDESGGWKFSKKGTDREYRGRMVLYRLPRVLAAKSVLYLDGERDVHTAEKLGLVGTCNALGGKSFRAEYAGPFRGKRVVIVLDNDKAGREQGMTVVRYVKGIASDVRILDPGRIVSGFPDGGDLSDWVKHFGGDREKLLAMMETHAEPPPSALLVRTMAEVQHKRTLWLVELRIPRADVTIIGGKQGVGKSLVVVDMAARISRGAEWPDGKGKFRPGNVILFAKEDADWKLNSRLAMANADQTRIHLIGGVPVGDGRRRTFDIRTDLPYLTEQIGDIGDVRAIFMDPVDSYIGNVNPNDNQQVRDAIMEPLMEFAHEHEIPIIVCRHFRKSLTDCAIDKLIGASAWTQVARSVIFVDYEDRKKGGPGRIFVPVKNNYAALPKGLLFDVKTVSSSDLYEGKHPDGLHDVEAVIYWRDGELPFNAEEIYDATDPITPGKVTEAVGLLISELEKEPQPPDPKWSPRPMKELEALAEDAGISLSVLYRAKNQLNIRSERQGSHSVWMTPEQYAFVLKKLEREVPAVAVEAVKAEKAKAEKAKAEEAEF